MKQKTVWPGCENAGGSKDLLQVADAHSEKPDSKQFGRYSSLKTKGSRFLHFCTNNVKRLALSKQKGFLKACGS